MMLGTLAGEREWPDIPGISGIPGMIDMVDVSDTAGVLGVEEPKASGSVCISSKVSTRTAKADFLLVEAFRLSLAVSDFRFEVHSMVY